MDSRKTKEQARSSAHVGQRAATLAVESEHQRNLAAGVDCSTESWTGSTKE